jgi:predicted RNA-binding Zn ribbon-like protein
MVTSPASIRRSEPGYTFDFCGGDVAIDFTNTVGSRGDRREEHLQTFGDLIAWAEARGVLARADAQRLRRTAAHRPAAARAALEEAVALREALYRVIGAAAATREPSAADLACVNRHVHSAWSRLRLTPRRGALALVDHDAGARSLADAILTPVVRASVDLLTSDVIGRVRACADESCAWLFVDKTRSHTRRWCDMKVCGNRNKVRRFRQGD